jgi:hypothetical protein
VVAHVGDRGIIKSVTAMTGTPAPREVSIPSLRQTLAKIDRNAAEDAGEPRKAPTRSEANHHHPDGVDGVVHDNG